MVGSSSVPVCLMMVSLRLRDPTSLLTRSKTFDCKVQLGAARLENGGIEALRGVRGSLLGAAPAITVVERPM